MNLRTAMIVMAALGAAAAAAVVGAALMPQPGMVPRAAPPQALNEPWNTWPVEDFEPPRRGDWRPAGGRIINDDGQPAQLFVDVGNLAWSDPPRIEQFKGEEVKVGPRQIRQVWVFEGLAAGLADERARRPSGPFMGMLYQFEIDCVRGRSDMLFLAGAWAAPRARVRRITGFGYPAIGWHEDKPPASPAEQAYAEARDIACGRAGPPPGPSALTPMLAWSAWQAGSSHRRGRPGDAAIVAGLVLAGAGAAGLLGRWALGRLRRRRAP